MREKDMIGTVWEVNTHGIHLDHDGTHFVVVHMDSDGHVMTREKFNTLGDALRGVKALKDSLLRKRLIN